MKAGLFMGMGLVCLACAAPKYRYDFSTPTERVVADEKITVTNAVQHFTVSQAEYNEWVAEASKPFPPAQTLRPRNIRPASAQSPPVVRTSVPPSATVTKVHNDLKRSVIFVAGGAVALIIGGDVFVVAGSLSLLIGLIFGIKWVLRE